MDNNVFNLVTEKIIQSLEKEVVPWKKPWTSLVPQNINGRPYTGINRLLLNINEYKYPYFLTMKQANELGGHVKKGEKAHLAVFWKILTVPSGTDGEGTAQKIPYLRYYRVFNIEQTTLPISVVKNADKIQSETNDDTREPIQKAKELLASFKDLPVIEFNHEYACYIPALDKILLPYEHLFQSVEEFYVTEFHELVHSTGHEKRLNRKNVKRINSGSDAVYSKEELVAEIGACFLCNQVGITTTFDNSAAYIQGWVKALKKDPKMIVIAAGHAEKAVDFLIGRSAIY